MKRLRVVSCLVAVVALAGVFGVVDAAPPLPQAALSVSPNRVLDTRNGIGAPVGTVNPGVVLAVPIPQAAGATSVVLNLTATDAVGDGYVTAWPCGEPSPATSNLNFSVAHTVANAVVVKLGAGGVCLSSSVPVHLIADVSGWFTGTSDLTSTSPNRILDTRQTHDPLVADQVRELRVAGQPTIGAGASMAVLNLTVDRPSAAGWLVAYPCGQPTDASTVNFGAGEVVANLALVDLSGGSVCFNSSVGVDLIVDTFGWSTETGQLKVQSPTRLLDTRSPASSPSGAARSGSTITLNVGGRGGVPATADSAVLTVTVTNPRAEGYVTVWPCDQALPNASTINTWPNAQRSNVALVRLSRTDGSVCLQYWSWNGTTTDLIVDAVGWTDGTNGTTPANGTPTPTPTPTPVTTPGPGGVFTDGFADLSRWSFAHWRNEVPGNGSAASAATVVSGEARIIAADQNYGDATLRSDTKYDLSRGGEIRVTLRDDGGGLPLIGSAFVGFTPLPYNAPSITRDNGQGPTPESGVYVQLRDNCRVPWGGPQISTYVNHVESVATSECLAAAPTGPVEMRYSATGHVEFWSGGVKYAQGDQVLPTTGFLMLGVHNHASVKYSAGGAQQAVTGWFDNVSYSAGTGVRTYRNGQGVTSLGTSATVVFTAYQATGTITVNGQQRTYVPAVSASGSVAGSVSIPVSDIHVGNNTIVVGGATVANVDLLITGAAP